MASTLKILGQVSPSANTTTTLFSVSVATHLTLVNICNTNGFDCKVRLSVRPTGNALDFLHFLEYDLIVSANSSFSENISLMIQSGYIFEVYANSAGVAFTASGVEIT